VIVRVSVIVALLLAVRPAYAIYECGDQKDDCKCGKSNPYPCCSNGGNCTWWAWEDACCVWGIGLPGWGNANQWAGNAKANASFEVLTSPVVNSIGVRVGGTWGHVVFVTAVNGSTITVREMNCGGNYGMRTHTYASSYFDGGYIVPKGGPPGCTAAQSPQSQSCGQCGQQTRTCNSGTWGSWNSCTGEGPCAKGKTETQPCGANNTGKQTRTCSQTCQWGSWGTCSGVIHPDGGSPRDSSVPPSPESGIDPPPGDHGGMPAIDVGAGVNTVGGCGCQAGVGDPTVAGSLVLLVMLVCRSRRRSR
jgi:hypothetical protein